MRPGFACGRVSCCVKQSDPGGEANIQPWSQWPLVQQTQSTGPCKPACEKPCIRPAIFRRTNAPKELVCGKGVPAIK